MKITVRLVISEPANEDGFPIALRVSHGAARPQKYIGNAWPEQFSKSAQMVTDEHPYYEIMAQKILDLKSKGKKLLLTWIGSPRDLLDEIFKKNNDSITVNEFAAQWIAEQKVIMEALEKKGDLVARNRINGYIKVVENAVAQFKAFRPRGVAVTSLDYDVLNSFKKQQELAANSPATIHLYLRTLRMLYNKAVLQYKLKAEKPFEGIFKGLRLRSYDSKKKHLDIDTVRLLEGLQGLGVERGRARDLWLLQFYFGGCDLTDIYFMKNIQLRKGRVRFSRGKTNSDIIDLKVHPKAQAIINRWGGAGEYVFPWKKDLKFYENWRGRHGKHLIELQSRQNEDASLAGNTALRIDVLPDGGNLAIKVARHTFGNIAKSVGVEGDLLRELMGHERNEVDNYYKDKYAQDVRDAALFKVIG